MDGVGAIADQFVVIQPIVGRFEDFFNVIEKNKIANNEPFRWVGRRVIRLPRDFGLAKEPSGIVGKNVKSIVVHHLFLVVGVLTVPATTSNQMGFLPTIRSENWEG